MPTAYLLDVDLYYEEHADGSGASTATPGPYTTAQLAAAGIAL